jgi:Outer membrane lipoprotein
VTDDKGLPPSNFDAVERDLLRSAEVLDVPSEGAKRRARALLTLGTAAAVTLGVSSAGPLAAKTAWTVGRWTLGKGLLVGTVGLLAMAGAFYAASIRRPPAVPSAAPIAPPVVALAAPAERSLPDTVSATPLHDEAVSPPALSASTSVSASPQPGATPPLRAARAAVASATSASSAGLADEIAALDRARGLLEGGRTTDALSVLGDYDRRFPRGALRQEVAVTRIEALFKQGQAAEATTLANRFLTDHPASSHAEHLRRLIREAAASE